MSVLNAIILLEDIFADPKKHNRQHSTEAWATWSSIHCTLKPLNTRLWQPHTVTFISRHKTVVGNKKENEISTHRDEKYRCSGVLMRSTPWPFCAIFSGASASGKNFTFLRLRGATSQPAQQLQHYSSFGNVCHFKYRKDNANAEVWCTLTRQWCFISVESTVIQEP